ncbi:rho guanine nucleotide exchange factor 39 isoform X2 [Brienomyrus brachyistius]|uniref:rho guanine nucleotide exchange factor 39 isoform X2 n=1 Tax=Brienomyrus brachyistius TaxID=42636 RepID=UPI0020B2A3C0|nr:rho guanine nucleotide exchange factor 39 isoform X2 [Brienomyrus brachyistius]
MSLAPAPTGPPSSGVREQQERWERKRARTGRELVRTEQRYCHQLELVNTYFVEILKAKGTLRQDIRESIFSSIKAIHSLNQYKYFLRDLTENTQPDSPEFAQLSGAVKAVSEVAQRIQDNARSHENQLQLRRIQKLLTGGKSKVLVPGRWYIREGWLRTVPPKGTEVKPKMFFLFSDVLLLTTPCSPLHPTNGDKFSCQRVYALQDCTVGKVFGHTKSQGGLISLTFTEEKLLLMSSDQEDINDWYRSLSSAVGQLASRTTVVQKRDNLCRRPLRSAQTQSEPRTPSAGPSQPQPLRKRNMVTAETTGQCEDPPHSPRLPPGGGGASAVKKMKLTDAPAESAPEPAGSSCVIL